MHSERQQALADGIPQALLEKKEEEKEEKKERAAKGVHLHRRSFQLRVCENINKEKRKKNVSERENDHREGKQGNSNRHTRIRTVSRCGSMAWPGMAGARNEREKRRRRKRPSLRQKQTLFIPFLLRPDSRPSPSALARLLASPPRPRARPPARLPAFLMLRLFSFLSLALATAGSSFLTAWRRRQLREREREQVACLPGQLLPLLCFSLALPSIGCFFGIYPSFFLSSPRGQG